jgi:hypothetical protein
LGGVISLVFFILVIGLFPLFSLKARYKNSWKVLSQLIFWAWLVNFLLLIWVGACPVEFPYIDLARGMGIIYFGFFLYVS